MKTEEYDQLLEDIRGARYELAAIRVQEQKAMMELDRLLRVLDNEERRIAREALNHMPIASRKLVVGE